MFSKDLRIDFRDNIERFMCFAINENNALNIIKMTTKFSRKCFLIIPIKNYQYFT